MRTKIRLKASSAFFGVALLAGCAVGPDFERPPPPNVKAYEPASEIQSTAQNIPQNPAGQSALFTTSGSSQSSQQQEEQTSSPSKAAEEKTVGEEQKIVDGGAVPAAWWTLFQSEPLNAMIGEALKANPDLAAAEAVLKQAHETTEAGEGALYPSLDFGGNVVREKLSGIAFGTNESIPAFTLYNASVSVSYSPDIFGLARRTIEELAAQEEVERYQLEAVRIALSANVVTAAVTEASLRGQIQATNEILADEHKQLDLLQAQLDAGAINKAAVLAETAQLAQSKATLPLLEKKLGAVRHQLSVLLGRFPANEPEAHFDLADLKLPEEVPLSLPSQLVDQRPDVRAGEAVMHAASAGIGVAEANMLPQFPITGDIGRDAGKLAGLFEPGAGIWSIGAGITQPLFHGGTLLHQKRAAEAAYEEAVAEYRKTVLTAFQNVADTLYALRMDGEAVRADADAEKAAFDSLALSEDQYKIGSISYLSLLTAQQTEQQTKLTLVGAEAARYADTAALFQALGGGWWNSPNTGEKTDETSIQQVGAPADQAVISEKDNSAKDNPSTPDRGGE